MQNRKLLFTAGALVAFGVIAAFLSMANAPRQATAGSASPTATPCPPDWVPGPTPGLCVHGTFPGPPLTATPCPAAKVRDTYHGSGCGTPTVTPTSVRVPPMLTIDFTVNDMYEVTVALGQPLTFRLTYHNDDHRGINIEATVELDGVSQGASHCHISPGASCAVSTTGLVNQAGTLSAVARIEAAVESCALCPTVSVERSITVHVVGQPGDFNCDSSLNAIDAALILQLTAALIQPFDCIGAGDVNHDGSTNAIDASLILQYIADLIPPFT